MAIRKIQIRRDTADNWETHNPTLSGGELGLNLDAGLIKVGDGQTDWNDLGYLSASWDTIYGKPPETDELPFLFSGKANLSGGNVFFGIQDFRHTVLLGTQASSPAQPVRADREIRAGTGLSVTNAGRLTEDITLSLASGGISTTHVANGAITDEKIGGTISVPKGGTGRTSLPTNTFLVGNGNSPVQTLSPVEAVTLIGAVPVSQVGVANGVAPLGANGRVPTEILPDSVLGGFTYQGTWDAASNTPQLLDVDPNNFHGDFYIVSVQGTTSLGGNNVWNPGDFVIYSTDEGWERVAQTAGVSTVSGRTGDVVLNAGDIESGVFDIARIPTGMGTANVVSPGNHTHALQDLNNVDAPANPDDNAFLMWDGSAWIPGTEIDGGSA